MIRENVRFEIELLLRCGLCCCCCFFSIHVECRHQNIKLFEQFHLWATARSSLIINHFDAMTLAHKNSNNHNYFNSHVKMIGHMNGSGSNFLESSCESESLGVTLNSHINRHLYRLLLLLLLLFYTVKLLCK